MQKVILIIAGVCSLLVRPVSADSAWDWNSRRMSASADITGDGRPETIRLQCLAGKNHYGHNQRYYRLTVNGQSIYDSPSAGVAQGFRLADINKHDVVKEIVVDLPYLEGSDFGGSMIYWFDGKSVRRVTRRPFRSGRFLGDGRVLAEEHLGYLAAQIPYHLQHNHTLQPAKQKYFWVGFNTSVKVSFPIYSRPDLKRVAMLRKGTKVHIFKSDLGDWLYLRAGRKTYGWMNTRWNNQYRAFGYPAVG